MLSFLKKKKEVTNNNEMIYAPVKGKAVASKEGIPRGAQW